MSRLVFGLQPVRECLVAHRGKRQKVERVLLERSRPGMKSAPRLDALARLAEREGARVERLRGDELDKLAQGGRHQGAIAFAPPLELVALDELDLGPGAVVLVLDGVVDPQNFGALVRSAVALGATAIVWAEHASAPLSPAMGRASAGAVEHATLVRVPSLTTALDELGARGVTTVLLDPDGEAPLEQVDLTGPVAIVVGAEEHGARKGVRRACAVRAALPMQGPLQSLNASVSGALALYEVGRQRRSVATNLPTNSNI